MEENKKEQQIEYEKPELVELSLIKSAMGACTSGSGDADGCTSGAGVFGEEPGAPPGP